MNLVSSTLLRIIRLYQRFLSPVLGNHCRYLPSCSEYALMAISEWGALRGGGLAAWRILRCNPFVRGGLDLPPSRRRVRNTVLAAGVPNEQSAGGPPDRTRRDRPEATKQTVLRHACLCSHPTPGGVRSDSPTSVRATPIHTTHAVPRER